MLGSFMSRGFRRRLRLGLQTLLGKPAGFFIPYRYADSVSSPVVYESALALCDAAAEDFRAVLRQLNDYRTELAAIGVDAEPPAPRWGQDWFAPLDAAILYAIIRARKPARIIEIGSGHSTRFAARAIADGKLNTQHIAIDPAPRADIAALPLTLQRCVLAQADPAIFSDLAAGDILFVDSSHILMPGTDVDQLFTGVLPALKAGVIVHVHDIFLPDGYPADWAWRGYNEQSALLPFIASEAFRLLFAGHYAETRLAAEIAHSPIGTLPRGITAAPATSFWLEKR